MYHSLKGRPAKGGVLKHYEAQKERGSEGFGFVSVAGGKLARYARTATEKGIRKLIAGDASELVLFHHRYPTSTINVPEAAHPIVVKNDLLARTYYVVHNGIINNDSELKEAHEKLGFEYTTEIRKVYKTTGKIYEEFEWNDSEALAIELALVIEGKKKMVEATGSYAFIVFEIGSGKKLTGVYFGTNGGSPLTLSKNRKSFVLRSDGGKSQVESGVLFRYDPTSSEVEKLDKNIGVVNYPTSSGMVDYGWYNESEAGQYYFEGEKGWKKPQGKLDFEADPTSRHSGGYCNYLDAELHNWLATYKQEREVGWSELADARIEAQTTSDWTEMEAIEKRIAEVNREIEEVEFELAYRAED